MVPLVDYTAPIDELRRTLRNVVITLIAAPIVGIIGAAIIIVLHN